MELIDVDEVFPVTANSPVVPVSEASGLSGQVITKLARLGLLDIPAFSDTGAGDRAEAVIQAAKQLHSQLREANNLR